MCGPTDQQKELAAEQSDFYKSAIEESNKVFGEQQDLQKQIEGVFSPILARGPNQMGYSTDELNLLKAQAVEGTATNYSKAAKALNERLAAQGGGAMPLPTGAQEQLQGDLMASSAKEQSGEETGILQSGYEHGYQEFSDATKAIEDVSGELSPTSYSGAATSSGTAAANTANTIAAQSNSWLNAVMGAAGSLGSSAIDMNPRGIFG